MSKEKDIQEYFDEVIDNPKCSLNFKKDYELLIATLLSAQCTDERVNKVTPILFDKFDIFKLAESKPEDIIDIIRPCGNMNKKSVYIIDIAKKLVKDHNGKVPIDREYLMTLPGIGRKTINVVLANAFGIPTFAVDTHVERVSKRLGLAKESDDVLTIENILMNMFDEKDWIKLHHQFLLFGRYTCKAINPKCDTCKLSKYCNYKKDGK